MQQKALADFHEMVARNVCLFWFEERDTILQVLEAIMRKGKALTAAGMQRDSPEKRQYREVLADLGTESVLQGLVGSLTQEKTWDFKQYF